jgi:outer membrane protein TolC
MLISSRWALAETLSFTTAWKKINSESPSIESSRLQFESITQGQARAARHWLPRVYIDAKTYQTNDPGASFFGILQQRSAQQNDFIPNNINHPNTQVYSRGALGIDLALYEGGMKSAQTELYKHSAAAQENATSQIQIEQYSQVGFSYASIAVLQKQKKKLDVMNSEIIRMVKRYELGNKSNPAGYSGLLGMKSLANRINGLINQYTASSNSHYAVLKEMGLGETNATKWSPEDIDSKTFVNRYFFHEKDTADTTPSFKTESAQKNVLASLEMANMEKAKYRPRIAAFAESYLFNGDRNTASGYTAGLYLQWNLFDPAIHGSLKEAKLKSLSAAKYAEASQQQEQAERAALAESILSLQQNLELLEDSYKILIEQGKMTGTLFQNGSISALQIVEVLSRRADLIEQQSEAELGLLKAASLIITKERFNIASHVDTGAAK